MNFVKFIATLAFIGMIAAAGIFFYGVTIYKSPSDTTSDTIIYIEPGTSTYGIAEIISYSGLIGNSTLHAQVFIYAAKLTQAKLKAGEYNVKARASIEDILRLLKSGKTLQHSITIPEGLMTVEIIDLLKAETALDGNITNISAEGNLLPETYSFSRNDTRQKIIDRMQSAMKETLADEWEKRASDVPLKSPEEAIILASIVEKETGIASERPRVAGVFVNRLNQNMALQTDPTVIYAITQGKKKLERELYFKDLKINSPYNTYLVSGLPPTPIANPGKASISAALNPEKHDYIYFVADGTGGHVFAKTLKEHNNNVANWRKIQKNSK